MIIQGNYSHTTFTLQPPSPQQSEAGETERCEEASHMAQMWEDVCVCVCVCLTKNLGTPVTCVRASMAGTCARVSTYVAAPSVAHEEVLSTWLFCASLTRASSINEQKEEQGPSRLYMRKDRPEVDFIASHGASRYCTLCHFIHFSLPSYRLNTDVDLQLGFT